ncbi:hypothetical protein V493_01534 [Pseudogymnoascus sp. VKM F-4281 (FW-2241)]|nr:hypothetical protein V493_01534 [Pseudogymnoascus sp. VKM F-4281 (FW-2241)]
MPSNPITFDVNGLYNILLDIGSERHFHWGFYLATEPRSGIIYYVINGPQTGDQWQYQTKRSQNVPSSVTLLTGMKIAVIEPLLHEALTDRLAAVEVEDSSRYGLITCRVWLKEALHILDDEGYIKLTAPVPLVEDEAIETAADNKPRGRRTVFKCGQCSA